MFRFAHLSIRGSSLLSLLLLVPVGCLGQTANGAAHQAMQGDPPFSGTIFIDPDIITASDPTTFQSVSYTGQDSRQMFDRRVNAFITVDAYLFDATFDDGLTAEIQVNPEFGSSDAALAEAQKYASVIGQLPTALRTDVQTVWIHKGVQPFGGGNNNLLIHIGQADLYVQDGILEETLVHEASHTSLDAYHASASEWLAAQTADGEFISTYARDFPDREDIAESFLPFLAVRYRSDRISQELHDAIVQTIPNRIAYFDNQSFNMYPIESFGVAIERVGDEVPEEFALNQNYPNPFNPVTTITYELPQRSSVSVEVYDLLGKEVAVLASGQHPAGHFQATWDGIGFPTGVYVYQLRTQTFSQTRKMLLLK